MAMLEFVNGTSEQISEHFNAYEFRCKCGKKHKIYIDTNLINVLEKARSKLNASKCEVVSGFRCPEHNAKVGGSKTSPHMDGKGGDVRFYDQKGKKILSKIVCLTLEDMCYAYGVGHGSGKDKYETHVDTKDRGFRFFFDEMFKPYKNCHGSFYKYFGIPKENDNVQFTNGIYKADANMYIRTKPSLTGRRKKVKELNKVMQKALTSNRPNDYALTSKGHTFTASEIIVEKNGRTWFKNLNNGYICLQGKDKKVYFTKVR